MLATIHFNHQPPFKRAEINNVFANGVLPSEIHSVQFISA